MEIFAKEICNSAIISCNIMLLCNLYSILYILSTRACYDQYYFFDILRWYVLHDHDYLSGTQVLPYANGFFFCADHNN